MFVASESMKKNKRKAFPFFSTYSKPSQFASLSVSCNSGRCAQNAFINVVPFSNLCNEQE